MAKLKLLCGSLIMVMLGALPEWERQSLGARQSDEKSRDPLLVFTASDRSRLAEGLRVPKGGDYHLYVRANPDQQWRLESRSEGGVGRLKLTRPERETRTNVWQDA